MSAKLTVFWFRRDLRLEDNHGLYEALSTNDRVLPIFVFDTEILSRLDHKKDRRVDFITQTLQKINQELEKTGKSIKVFHGNPLEIFKALTETYPIEMVFCNEDYEPAAIIRDATVKAFLNNKNIEFRAYKDQVHYHKNEILKADQMPYTVYTPYSKQWLLKYNSDKRQHYPSERYLHNLVNIKKQDIYLEMIGFQPTDLKYEGPAIHAEILRNYHETRNFPATKTSEMSAHLRFGTISVRTLAQTGAVISEIYLKELIWREFFMQILYHFPKVVHQSFKAKYDRIPWIFDEESLKKWQDGKTGFPLIDAGMRELNDTGLMHNRVRMVCASFLTKHLLIDWRIGEAYFADKLLDYDLSANNGNWQWAAGSGCDAAPYFRVFNPEEQQKKFDPDFIYIKKWVRELGTSDYPKPMIEHRFARERALETYKKALQENL